MKDEKCRQPTIKDFCDKNVKPPTPEEQKKRARKRLKTEATYHLEEFIRLFFESLDRNSVELQLFFACIHRTLTKMEADGVCYLKKMPNDKTRIFKKVYCCLSLQDWKKCPEYRCPVWPCNEESECPHNPHEDEATLGTGSANVEEAICEDNTQET